MAHYLLYLLHGDGIIEHLIVLPGYSPRDKHNDLSNVLIPVIAILSHYPFEVAGYLFLNLFPSVYLGPIFSFDSMDLQA